MAGDVGAVRRFLARGGYADTVYKNEYGWKVGPEYMHAKPADGMTILNYLCFRADLIDAAAPEIGRLLVEAGASLERDDGQERWFTPLHNAVANGASQLVDVLLSFKPSAIALTTGDGQSPLHVAALCQDTELRRRTVEVLLGARHVWQWDDDPQHTGKWVTFAYEHHVALNTALAAGTRSITLGKYTVDLAAMTQIKTATGFKRAIRKHAVQPDLEFAEPYFGHTALHEYAKQGHWETAVLLLEAGAPATARNFAGRTALEELKFELRQLETQRLTPEMNWRRLELLATMEAMEMYELC